VTNRCCVACLQSKLLQVIYSSFLKTDGYLSLSRHFMHSKSVLHEWSFVTIAVLMPESAMHTFYAMVFLSPPGVVWSNTLCFWLLVCLCVCPSVCASQTFLIRYFEKYWTCFHQTFGFGAFWDKINASTFGNRRSKFKDMVGSNVLENALFGLISEIS